LPIALQSLFYSVGISFKIAYERTCEWEKRRKPKELNSKPVGNVKKEEIFQKK
jgi:hypothetical protein